MTPAPPTPFASLSGQIACVTGASSGIGREIALELARAGADVAIHCRQSVERAEHVAHEIRQFGRRAACFAFDLADPKNHFSLVDAVWSQFGACDIWVNNAGVDLLTGEGSTLSFSQKLERLLAVDVTATLHLSREAGRRMKTAGQGTLLNIGVLDGVCLVVGRPGSPEAREGLLVSPTLVDVDSAGIDEVGRECQPPMQGLAGSYTCVTTLLSTQSTHSTPFGPPPTQVTWLLQPRETAFLA